MRRRQTLMLLLAGLLVLSAGAADAGTWRHWRFYDHWGPSWYWYSHSWGPRVLIQLRDNDLAVVDTDIRPERARLYLDGSFIGIADDFDGNPDYLYLKPGQYLLEVKLGGFTTEKVELEIEDNQWYELDFKMQRIPNEPKEEGRPVRPEPVTRYFEPSQPQPAQSPSRAKLVRPGGPDLSLRPDLASRGAPQASGEVQAQDTRAASLQLQVQPANASVYLDGAFLGTGEQLVALEAVAVKPGRHTIEVLAPGLRPERRVFDIGAGEAIELQLLLQQNE